MKVVIGIIVLTVVGNMVARGQVSGVSIDPSIRPLALILPYLAGFFGTIYAAIRLATSRTEQH